MNIKDKNMIDCELKVKSTANLRKQIISELTQPDKSLLELFEKENNNNDSILSTQDCSGGKTNTRKP